MKENDIVVKFRRAYNQLGYVKNRLTVNTLRRWVETWCQTNGIYEEDMAYFIALSSAYADKDLFEHHIRLWQKK